MDSDHFRVPSVGLDYAAHMRHFIPDYPRKTSADIPWDFKFGGDDVITMGSDRIKGGGDDDDELPSDDDGGEVAMGYDDNGDIDSSFDSTVLHQGRYKRVYFSDLS